MSSLARIMQEANRLERIKNRRIEPITRKNLEQARIRVTYACLITAVRDGNKKPPVRHLWFEEDNANNYRLRAGNPPADVDRPEFLRGMHLVIDLGSIPIEVWDSVKAKLRAERTGTGKPTSIIDVVNDPRTIEHVRQMQDGRHLPRG